MSSETLADSRALVALFPTKGATLGGIKAGKRLNVRAIISRDALPDISYDGVSKNRFIDTYWSSCGRPTKYKAPSSTPPVQGLSQPALSVDWYYQGKSSAAKDKCPTPTTQKCGDRYENFIYPSTTAVDRDTSITPGVFVTAEFLDHQRNIGSRGRWDCTRPAGDGF